MSKISILNWILVGTFDALGNSNVPSSALSPFIFAVASYA